MNWKKVEIVFELLIFGILIGVVEDLVAIKFVTNEPITICNNRGGYIQ